MDKVLGSVVEGVADEINGRLSLASEAPPPLAPDRGEKCQRKLLSASCETALTANGSTLLGP